VTADGVIEAVHASPGHTMGKPTRLLIRLIEGHGIEGDAHAGTTVKHRSRVRRGDGSQPNLRQVHLIPAEVHDELRAEGYPVTGGEMGENITTRGVDLLALPVGTRLHLGPHAVVEVTGRRKPCKQLDGVQPGLMAAVLDRDEAGDLTTRAGVMSVVVAGGDVSAGDPVRVELPAEPHRPLEFV
jgi:hypothetical protein